MQTFHVRLGAVAPKNTVSLFIPKDADPVTLSAQFVMSQLDYVTCRFLYVRQKCPGKEKQLKIPQGDSPIRADLSRPTRAGASPAPTIYGLDRLLRRMVGATLAVALALKSAPMGDSPVMGQSHHSHHYVGHTHFWERALLSCRQFVRTAAGATGVVLASRLWMPGIALADNAAPKPIPGDIQPLVQERRFSTYSRSLLASNHR